MTKPHATIGLISLSIISSIMLSSSFTLADEIDEINITVPISCTMSGIGMQSHNAEMINGTYVGSVEYDAETGEPTAFGIGSTTLHVFCNDNNGFAIYATGYTGNEIGGTNSTKLVGTGTSNNATIITGTATGPIGGNDISNWAMALSVKSDSGDTTSTNAFVIDSDAEGPFNEFHSVPSSYTKVAHKNSATDMTASTGGAKLTTTYAAYISKTQPADTYSGQVIYTLVHPSNETPLQPQTATSNCINYFPNGSNVVGTMGCQSIGASDTSARLLASNFSRTGYGFAGWSDSYDYATNPNAKLYGPQEDITFTAGQYTGTNPGLALYAVWIKSAGNLQDSSKVATLCGTGTGSLTTAPTDGTANLSSVSALTDQRDNETYAIAKLADGKCWMIENLRLEAEYTTRSGDEALAQGYGHSTTYGNFTGLATAESANFTNTDPPVANSKYSPSTDGDKVVIGTNNFSYARMPRYNNTNTQSRASSPTENTTSIYSYGNYYTWSAAIANTIHYNLGTDTDADGKTSETVGTSLCPAGWRLPRGGDKSREATNDLWALVVTGINNGTNPANYSSGTPYYNGSSEAGPVANKLRAYPNNFLYSGYFSTSSATNRGSYGRYWSSTASGSYLSYNLRLGSSNVTPGTNSLNKYLGGSIRCLLSPST